MSEKNKETKKKRDIRYVFAILKDETHEYVFAIRAKKHAAISALVGLVVLFVVVLFSLIAFTPIKRTLPGFPSYRTQREIVDNAAKVDSLEIRMKIMSFQLDNIRRILSDQEPIPVEKLFADIYDNGGGGSTENFSYAADSIMRTKVDSIERYNVQSGAVESRIEGQLLFPPVSGVITESYNVSSGHPFIDIAVTDNTPVCAILDGTVIAAYWDDNTGYNIYLQHKNDLLSIYKHNTKLLKDVGDKVTAGTTISLCGDAGNISTGPHLHLELWYKGEPIDPALYINF